MLKTFNQLISVGIFTVLSIILITCAPKNSDKQTELKTELSGELNGVIAIQTENSDESHKAAWQEFDFPPKINLIQHSNFASSYHPVRYARIWGWSADGKAAYSIEGGLNSEASYQIDFKILDLDTNNELFNLTIFSDIYPDSDNDWAEAYFKIHREDIVNALITHRINKQQTDFLPFPITKNNNRYYAQIIDIEYGEDEKWLLGDTILKYTLSITDNDKRKIIGTYKPFLWLFDADVCGYFLSPLENKILIVIAEDLGQYQHGGILFRFIGLLAEEI